MARILLTTFGSYGDLHPYMSIGIELQRRGHAVTIATMPVFAGKVTSEGLSFHPVRPGLDIDDKARVAEMMDTRHGTERVLRFFCSSIRESYEDTLAAAQNSDLLVSHPITFGSVIAAEKAGVPWVSSVLAPASFCSAYDPPVPAPTPWIVKARAFGPGFMRCFFRLVKFSIRRWVQPIVDLRRELGLPDRGNPVFEGAQSPRLVLALFSRYMAEPQPDWPPQTLVTGFPFFDKHHELQTAPELDRFLQEGEPPIVFTLGSSAVAAAGDFYRESLQAVRQLGARAVFLTGPLPQGLPDKMPPGTLTAAYVPHSEIFPHAAAIVHQGGVGTTAQAMRAGRPMLVVPFAHDQYDNAERVKRLGAAEVIYRSRYNAKTAQKALARLPAHNKAAEQLGIKVRAENGTASAADALELILGG